MPSHYDDGPGVGKYCGAVGMDEIISIRVVLQTASNINTRKCLQNIF